MSTIYRKAGGNILRAPAGIAGATACCCDSGCPCARCITGFSTEQCRLTLTGYSGTNIPQDLASADTDYDLYNGCQDLTMFCVSDSTTNSKRWRWAHDLFTPCAESTGASGLLLLSGDLDLPSEAVFINGVDTYIGVLQGSHSFPYTNIIVARVAVRFVEWSGLDADLSIEYRVEIEVDEDGLHCHNIPDALEIPYNCDTFVNGTDPIGLAGLSGTSAFHYRI